LFVIIIIIIVGSKPTANAFIFAGLALERIARIVQANKTTE